MIAAALLALGTLHLDPGFRTFPEIAALVGETPTEVRCDPGIAHRMVFARADAISRAGLLDALGLTVVPDGKRRLMKDARAAEEREWAIDVRRALERRDEISRAEALAVADAKIPDPVSETDRERAQARADQLMRALNDPEAKSEDRRRGIEELARLRLENYIARDEVEAGVRALAAFPVGITPELMERGFEVDVRPLTAIPRRAIEAFRRAYPALRGGPESIVVRTRTLGSGFWIRTKIGIVDPGAVGMPAETTTTILGTGFAVSRIAGLLRSDAERTIPLRRLAAEIAKIRAAEAPGFALADAYGADVPFPERPQYASLSNVAQAWAEHGRNVVMELDPPTEYMEIAFDGKRLRRDGDWSPGVVEGVLTLRPLARFLTARRRYPYHALFAFEAAGPKPETTSMYSQYWPSDTAMAAYVERAGPEDRWGVESYRGWSANGFSLDAVAAMRRLRALIPQATLEAADRAVREARARQPASEQRGATRSGPVSEEPIALWRVALADLSPASQAALGAEMRANGEGTNILAHSPSAFALLIREGRFELRVRDTLVGYARTIDTCAPSVPQFGWMLAPY